MAWKVLSDGSNQGRSGYLRRHYVGQPDNRGHANMDIEQCIALIKAGHDAGWRVMTHANGDAALDMVVSAYEQALETSRARRIAVTGSSTARWQVPEHFERMARVAVHPELPSRTTLTTGAEVQGQHSGPERANELDQLPARFAAGLRPSLHSDYP